MDSIRRCIMIHIRISMDERVSVRVQAGREGRKNTSMRSN